MATPLINPLRVSGGTMYAFSSSVRDMQKSLMDNDIVFTFSKFALLDLPDVDLPSGGLNSYENKIVWESVSENEPYQNSDLNITESFQNYLLNKETYILTKNNSLGNSYDNNILQNTSERLFWKWLTKLNAIKFKQAESSKTNTINRYEELSNEDYNKVVKYIGDIDVTNNNSLYTEVYLHVPSDHGTTPTVLFKTIEDVNYKPNLEWLSTTNPDYIDGRNETSTHPAGLSLLSFYDNRSLQKYETENSFGLTTYTPIEVKGVTLMISNMDGAVLDFETTSYSEIKQNTEITNFRDFNSSDKSENFKFNVALIYYNTYKQSNPSVVYRNLYGVLVLDNYRNGTEFDELKRFDKFKSNILTGLNGNGYSLKFNMKLDTSVSNLGVEKVINEYNTFSLDVFVDAISQLKRATASFEKQTTDIIDIKNRLTNLENYYFTQDDIDGIKNKISQLEYGLYNANMAFSDKSTLLNLINKNADNINNILSGTLSLNLTYNTNVLYASSGIELDKSVKNKIYIKNTTPSYNTRIGCKNDNTVLSFEYGNGDYTNSSIGNVITLGEFVNYYRYDITDQTLTTNLVINIEDKDFKWKQGQVFKLYFNKNINLESNLIIINTDFKNKYKQIASIDSDSLISNYPIIEIVCKDAVNLIFDVNILR